MDVMGVIIGHEAAIRLDARFSPHTKPIPCIRHLGNDWRAVGVADGFYKQQVKDVDFRRVTSARYLEVLRANRNFKPWQGRPLTD